MMHSRHRLTPQVYGRAFSAMLAALLLSVTACEDDRVVYDVYDYDEVIRYIYETSEGKELFRTDNLIPEIPYTKPGNDSIFTELMDSVTRYFEVTTTPDSVEKDFGSPYYVMDDAEVVVNDFFYFRTRAVLGNDTNYIYRERELERKAYFLRQGSETQPYSGWIMKGFNGGEPRSPALLEMIREDGTVFHGDQIALDEYVYDKYTTRRYIDSLGQPAIGVDTSYRVSSKYAYTQLQDMGEVRKGERLAIRSIDNDNTSAYELVAARTDSGTVMRAMSGPISGQYVDTIVTPAANSDLYNLVLFREFRTPDRPGRLWCVPYRARD